MPAEFQAWLAFYRLHPFDDDHRYFRPAALISHAQGGADVKEFLSWLRLGVPVEPVATVSDSQAVSPAGYSQAELNSIRAHGFVPPRRDRTNEARPT